VYKKYKDSLPGIGQDDEENGQEKEKGREKQKTGLNCSESIWRAFLGLEHGDSANSFTLIKKVYNFSWQCDSPAQRPLFPQQHTHRMCVCVSVFRICICVSHNKPGKVRQKINC